MFVTNVAMLNTRCHIHFFLCRFMTHPTLLSKGGFGVHTTLSCGNLEKSVGGLQTQEQSSGNNTLSLVMGLNINGYENHHFRNAIIFLAFIHRP